MLNNFDSLDYLLLLAEKAGLSVVDPDGKIIGKKDESESANSQSVTQWLDNAYTIDYLMNRQIDNG